MTSENLRTLLLVEDDTIIAMANSRFLMENGFKVIVSGTGEDAVLKVKEFCIDLVLMDIDLGEGIDGTEAAKQVLLFKEIPIVFLTSHLEKELVEKVMKITRYGYVDKNSGKYVLLSSIEMAFELFTMHKKTKEKEELFQLIAENTLDLIALHDMDGKYIYLSPSVERILGYTSDELIGINPYNLFHPEDAIRIQNEFISKSKTGEDGLLINYRFLSKNGSYVWLETILKLIWNKNRTEIVQMQTVSRDITQRKIHEQEIQNIEIKYQSLIENLEIGILIQDANSKILLNNPAAEGLLGLTADQMRGKTSFDKDWNVIQEDGIEFPRESHPIQVCIKTKKPVLNVVMGVYRPLLQDRVWLLVSAKPELSDKGEIKQVICTFQDITKSRLDAILMHEKEERLRFALVAGNQGMYDLDLRTGNATVNCSYAEMLGYDFESFEETNLKWKERLHEKDRDIAYKAYTDYVQGKANEYKVEFRLKTKDGNWKWILSYGKIAEWDANNKAVRMIGTHTDITDKKISELMQKARNHVLDSLIAKKDLPLILKQITEEIEFIHPEMHASILLLDSRGRLIKGAAPSLPDFYNDAVDGIIPGIGVGSCGTAVATGKLVVVPDISSHEYWEKYKALAEAANLRACWSFPFKDDSGKVLGTFAAYYLEPRSPSPSELNIIMEFSRITGLAVQNDKTEKERIKAEEEVKSLLLEKEILLKEVHHRIKNNMASISSLLSLQADHVNEPKISTILEEAQNRILGMMLVYDKLFRSVDYKNISVKEYLHDLLDQILISFPGGSKVTIEKRIEDFNLNSKSLFSVGIIVNELITNSFKYAFTEMDKGKIIVTAKKTEANNMELTVADDGKGLPVDFNIKNSTGFGLSLIKLLTQKKPNNFEVVESNTGAKFRVLLTV